MSIELVPDLKKYPHIYNAHKDNKLILFVGAGVSALWGVKRWQDMAETLIENCFDDGLITYWNRKILLEKYGHNPRKLITIAKAILGDNYFSKLSKIVVPSAKKDKYPQLFSNLSSINAIFVTTNIDTLLSDNFSKDSVHVGSSEFVSEKIQPKNCFHLHGSIKDNNPLVMTIEEYVLRYKDPKVKDFLEYIFLQNEFVVVFMGYGMDELEIIDYMLEKYGDEVRRQPVNKYYILFPIFRNEEELLKHEQTYFNQINMTVIPYAIDDRGHDQLDDLVQTWKKEFTPQDEADEFYKFTKLIEDNK